jgi:polyvinyl alcohol dehydrogenase (cytochrome)
MLNGLKNYFACRLSQGPRRSIVVTSIAASVMICASLTWFSSSHRVEASASESSGRGKTIYRDRCMACHDSDRGRIPDRRQLHLLTQDAIVHALADGVMKTEAQGLSAGDRIDVAAFLATDEGINSHVAPIKEALAHGETAPCGFNTTVGEWNGWGRDIENSRYEPHPLLTAAKVPELKLKWAFGLPGKGVRGQPTVVGGRVYVSASEGHVYSLDANTGATCWVYESGGSVRSAVSVGSRMNGSSVEYSAYFGDDQGFVHAIDALTGHLIWKVKVDDFEGALITGAPVLYKNKLYVPVSSSEEMRAGFFPNYECCKFRGSIVALDATNGTVLWKTYAIPTQPALLKKTANARRYFGPAGAAVWGAPTIDEKRNRIYFATGNSYTDAPNKASDAIFALDLDTGAVRWSRQVTEQDDYVMNCRTEGQANCPQKVGDDFDFGASPILHNMANGRQVILAGQKSGVLYALDPDNAGTVLWTVRLSSGGSLGGIEWGPGADSGNVYVAISDVVPTGKPAPGLYAVSASNGRIKWQTPAPSPPCSWGLLGCSHAQSAAVTVIPGIVFSGALDGHLRAYASDTGQVVWDVDTAISYSTVNGIPARGGSLDTGGPAVENGVVYVNSGYALIAGHTGNALLAYSVPPK